MAYIYPARLKHSLLFSNMKIINRLNQMSYFRPDNQFIG
jgi:hypothetical protein